MIPNRVLIVYDESVSDIVYGVNQCHPQDITEDMVLGTGGRGQTR